MQEKHSALLVYQQPEPLRSLKVALERQGVETVWARNCKEAGRILRSANPPQLVFTDTKLPDGVWADVLALAARAPQPVNVIVVARLVDTRLYVVAIEAGAFDFLAPPFTATDLAHVLRCASDNVQGRREAQERVDGSAMGKLFPAIYATAYTSDRRHSAIAYTPDRRRPALPNVPFPIQRGS